MSDKKTRVGIIGASSLVAGELIKILLHHPYVEITCLISERHAGEPIESAHGFLRGCGLTFDRETGEEGTRKVGLLCDVVFLATRSGVAQQSVPELVQCWVKLLVVILLRLLQVQR